MKLKIDNCDFEKINKHHGKNIISKYTKLNYFQLNTI